MLYAVKSNSCIKIRIIIRIIIIIIVIIIGLAPVEGAAGGLDEVEGLIAIPPVDDTGSLADALNQDRRYVATCNKSTIKQVARMIAEFGDQLAIFDYESKRPKSPKQKVHATVSKLFKSAFETLGIILDEVEQMKRPKDLGTEEGEQRGILKFAGKYLQLNHVMSPASDWLIIQ